MGKAGKMSTLLRIGVCVFAGLLLTTVGCGSSDGAAVREVLVKRDLGSDVEEFSCINFETGGLGDMLRAKREARSGQENYSMRAWPGALLCVELEPSGSSRRVVPLVYHATDKEPLVFSATGPTLRLNEEPVALDLAGEAGHAWLKAQSKGAIESIRTLSLDGEGVQDAAALRRFAGRRVLLEIDKDYAGLAREDVREAIVATQPRGLVTRMTGELRELMPRLTRIEYLILERGGLPPISSLPSLRVLAVYCRGISEDKGDERSMVTALLAELAELKKLRSLRLTKIRHDTDLTPIGRLTGLRSLFLDDVDHLTDLSSFAELRELRFLTLPEAGGLTDLSHLENLENLIELVIAPIPGKVEDLGPIARLPQLKLLAVEKDDLKKHAERFEPLRKANPDLEIVGFCLGSAWILAIVPIAGVGAVLLRRRRARRIPA